ncbi:MAG: PLDc_N domain-containing protein [Elusimicrobia bacterium]|nr:PLDc_N domain-containing protein [Elusimicrobiota bacterium]
MLYRHRLNKIRDILLITSMYLCLVNTCKLFAQEATLDPSDKQAIYNLLEQLNKSLREKNLPALEQYLSPHMLQSKRNEIVQQMKEINMQSHDIQYSITLPVPPLESALEIIAPGQEIKFATNCQATEKSNKKTTNSVYFILEKIDGNWFIADTNFHSLEFDLEFPRLFGKWLWLLTSLLFPLLAIPFWLWLLIDCIKRDFPTETEKIIWLLVIILGSFIGFMVYYIVVKRKKKN